MAFATYTRKGSIARVNIKAMLESDSVFNQLTDTQQNTIIDSAVQQLAAYRNSLSKNDYNFDTVGNANIDVTLLGYTKYIRYIFVKSGGTYEGTTYGADTILIEQGPIGYTGAITTDWTLDLVTLTSAGSEFTTAILWDHHFANVIITRVSNDEIEIDLTDADDVVTFELFKN